MDGTRQPAWVLSLGPSDCLCGAAGKLPNSAGTSFLISKQVGGDSSTERGGLFPRDALNALKLLVIILLGIAQCRRTKKTTTACLAYGFAEDRVFQGTFCLHCQAETHLYVQK